MNGFLEFVENKLKKIGLTTKPNSYKLSGFELEKVFNKII